MPVQLTTPLEITTEIRAACRSICDEEPEWVAVRPRIGSSIGECFANAERLVKYRGGSVITGWLIWHWPGVLIHAEHHGVWRSYDGELVDVTPHEDGETRILFLPDASAALRDKREISKLFPDPMNQLARRYCRLRVERDSEAHPYRRMRSLHFTDSAQASYDKKTKRLEAMWRDMQLGRTD
jgi:hypothetical protein